MGTAENKKIALAYMQDISTGNTEGMLNAMAEHGTVWVAGEVPGLSGKKTKPELAKTLAHLGDYFPNGVKLTADNVIAEGDYVAVEGSSYADLGGGKIYRNTIHWAFKIRGGKIESFKEYLDPMKLKAAFGG